MINDYSDELTYTAGPPATSLQSYVGAMGVAILGGKVKNGGAAGDWISGEEMVPYFRNITAGAGAGFTGLLVEIISDSAATLIVAPTVLSTVTIPVASLTANRLIPLPHLTHASPAVRQQFLGLRMTPQGAACAAGTCVVGFCPAGSLPQNFVHQL